jgi:hypothetical protein
MIDFLKTKKELKNIVYLLSILYNFLLESWYITAANKTIFIYKRTYEW